MVAEKAASTTYKRFLNCMGIFLFAIGLAFVQPFVFHMLNWLKMWNFTCEISHVKETRDSESASLTDYMAYFNDYW